MDESTTAGLAHFAGFALTVAAFVGCSSSADSVSAPRMATASPTTEELFEVGPMPVVASGYEESAWVAFCVATATGYEIELVEGPQGGFEIDLSQPGYSDERWERASDYCIEEGFSRGHLPDPMQGPTQADLQADFEEQLAANACLVEQGIDQPEAPASLEEYQSRPWGPLDTVPMRALLGEDEEEYDALYRLCLGDEHISFVDWEP